MFTGIVQGLLAVEAVQELPGMVRFSAHFPSVLLRSLQIGASVAVDGVCLTVVKIEGQSVWFEVMQETLNKTTLQGIAVGCLVNIERSATLGDEIGGHMVSGHVFGRAKIEKIEVTENNKKFTFTCPSDWLKYIFPKGYIAIDGVSLTVVEVNANGLFSVCLIPETLRVTTLGKKRAGDCVNVEVDSQTQAIVETVERVLARKD